ncbi:MAG: TetR/AcrR family transcriptional regulator [Roseburia sp.]|nr:TetR/AcrR family transcriptional regulator [Roseburia sp.]
MYRQCTTEKTAIQQKRFQDTLLSAMQNHNYQDISVTDLCTQTGLSRNVFYRLFDHKEDVLYSLIDHYFLECSQYVSANNTKENLLLYFSFWKKQKTLLDILAKNQLSGYLAIRAHFFCHQTDISIRNLILTDWNNFNEEIFTFYIDGFIGLILYWHHTGFKRTEREMADIAFQFLSQPPVKIQ